jgi:maltose alpha-D-glucosyltransferase/alpha-amylase
VLGRGALEFLPCSNRKVLAYLRRDADETLLVVANLSRSLQPVEVDLSACAGLIPLEMFGVTEFPRVPADRPYFMTLAPYAAHWFSMVTQPVLVSQAMPSTDREAQPATASELPALLVGVNWENLLDSATRSVLERQALRPFLQRQRWFAAKSQTITNARFADWVMLRGGASPAFVTLVTVTYAEGAPETYAMPLALVAGEAGARAAVDTPGSVLARITGARKGAIVDGMLDDDVCNRLIDMAGGGGLLQAARSTLRGVPALGVGELTDDRKWVRAPGDSSNSVAFVSERYVLKLFRRIEPGPNPEFEIGRALTAQGFTRIPALAGAVVIERASGDDGGTLAVVQTAVANQGSGWTFTVEELRRYYERVAARISRGDGDGLKEGPELSVVLDGTEPPPFFASIEGWYLGAAGVLGRRTAEMHLALASAPDPAFAPEPFGSDELRQFRATLEREASSALDLLAAKLATLPEDQRGPAAQLLELRPALMARIATVDRIGNGGHRIRVHGDYHLGQVLRTEEDFIILDFEGEPARTLEERRARHSPLKDVAGMLRSFNYAASAALMASPQAGGATERLVPWGHAWQHWVSRAFLDGYRTAMGDVAIVPAGENFEALLGAFTLEKALYELHYELNNRPEWTRIPLNALVTLALPLQN